MIFEVKGGLDRTLLEEALNHLLKYHDALRLRYQQQGSEWEQRYEEDQQQAILSYRDLAGKSGEEQKSVLTAIIKETERSLNLSDGPLLKAVLLNRGENIPQYLFITIHHLVVDGVSWRILMEDLDFICRKLENGEDPTLPPKTSSFKSWAERLAGYAETAEAKEKIGCWKPLLSKRVPVLPADYPGRENTVGSVETIGVALTEAETDALVWETGRAYHTQITDLLLTALGRAFWEYTGEPAFLVDLENHGRETLIFEDLDLSRTVGWFTTVYPVVLEASRSRELGDDLKEVKERLREIPENGISYGVLRYLTSDREIADTLKAFPRAEVSFNYLGQFDTIFPRESKFSLAPGRVGLGRSEQGKRSYRLEINGMIIGGRLQFEWHYSKEINRRKTVERLAKNFQESLRRLIEHCVSVKETGYTPSDFPEAELSQASLNEILEKIDPKQRKDLKAIYRLSPMQEGILFHTLEDPDSDVYFEQLCFKFEGRLDRGAFKEAWQAITDRHDILRTLFITTYRKTLLQGVAKKATVPFTEYGWETDPEAGGGLDQFLEEDRKEGFDLTRAPLMRLILIGAGPEKYYFIWDFHHILLDGWSVSRTLQEVFTAYDKLSKGEKPWLKQAPEYREYINWLYRQDLEQAGKYWQEQLKGFTASTSLRIGTPDQLEPGYQTYEKLFPEETAQALEQFSRKHKITINTVVQAAWALVISKYGGEEDVIFGATVSGRPARIPEIERMVGILINTLPVRVKVNGTEQVLTWLERIQSGQVAQRDYDYTPLVKIKEWSELPQGRGYLKAWWVLRIIRWTKRRSNGWGR